ncbi:hypothetical protein ABTD98_20120, partial [Acinetobacter baumannii]
TVMHYLKASLAVLLAAWAFSPAAYAADGENGFASAIPHDGAAAVVSMGFPGRGGPGFGGGAPAPAPRPNPGPSFGGGGGGGFRPSPAPA